MQFSDIAASLTHHAQLLLETGKTWVLEPANAGRVGYGLFGIILIGFFTVLFLMFGRRKRTDDNDPSFERRLGKLEAKLTELSNHVSALLNTSREESGYLRQELRNVMGELAQLTEVKRAVGGREEGMPRVTREPDQPLSRTATVEQMVIARKRVNSPQPSSSNRDFFVD